MTAVGPVILLTYAQAGGGWLQSRLSGYPDLACTSGTGLLLLCDQAAEVWRQVDERPDPAVLSGLAASSIRSLAAGVIATITARAGRPRWCEVANVQQEAAETFLRLYPAAQFACVHRAVPGVIDAVLRARRWGVGGPAFTPYVAAHPASTVNALAAYWIAHASQLIAFEEAHPEACIRVTYEELAADQDKTVRAVAQFLGLADEFPSLPDLPPAPADSTQTDATEAAGAAGDSGGHDESFPVGQLPAPMLAQVNSLHAKLGYPPLDSGA